jgi:hypothetical protein
LSLAHFQNAFQRWVDRQQASDLAYDAAGRSLMVDDRDPAAHWAMGRALWLRGRIAQSCERTRRTIDLSPNFAMGHYSLSFVHAQAGDPNIAIASSDNARALSPFDPLLFGMFSTRAMSLVRLGQFEEAATWAVKGAARVNAHPHVLGLAALCLALAGSLDEARDYAAATRKTLPRYSVADFLDTFRCSRPTRSCTAKARNVSGSAEPRLLRNRLSRYRLSRNRLSRYRLDLADIDGAFVCQVRVTFRQRNRFVHVFGGENREPARLRTGFAADRLVRPQRSAVVELATQLREVCVPLVHHLPAGFRGRGRIAAGIKVEEFLHRCASCVACNSMHQQRAAGVGRNANVQVGTRRHSLSIVPYASACAVVCIHRRQRAP